MLKGCRVPGADELLDRATDDAGGGQKVSVSGQQIGMYAGQNVSDVCRATDDT